MGLILVLGQIEFTGWSIMVCLDQHFIFNTSKVSRRKGNGWCGDGSKLSSHSFLDEMRSLSPTSASTTSAFIYSPKKGKKSYKVDYGVRLYPYLIHICWICLSPCLFFFLSLWPQQRKEIVTSYLLEASQEALFTSYLCFCLSGRDREEEDRNCLLLMMLLLMMVV